MPQGCMVLLAEDVEVDARKYGDLAAPMLGLAKIEARIAVRKGRGILLENLREADAQRLVEELARDGVGARAVSCGSFPPLPVPRRVTALERGPAALLYQGASTGDREAVSWDAWLAASCGVVARSAYRDLFAHVPFQRIPPLHKLDPESRARVRDRLILKMSLVPEDQARPAARMESIFREIEEKYAGKVWVYLDLVTADLGRWLRVSQDELSYLYGAGGVRFGGAWGFELLVKDLRERSEGALSEMTLKLLGATDIKDLVFLQTEEFTRYTTWVALKRFLWPTGGSSSPSPGPTDADSSSASPGPGPRSTHPEHRAPE